MIAWFMKTSLKNYVTGIVIPSRLISTISFHLGNNLEKVEMKYVSTFTLIQIWKMKRKPIMLNRPVVIKLRRKYDF
ncbi:MAG: hypothetical protein ACQESB_06940 [Elusimicrobiota bacterium]